MIDPFCFACGSRTATIVMTLRVTGIFPCSLDLCDDCFDAVYRKQFDLKLLELSGVNVFES